MGFFTRLATKSMCAVITKSLPNASTEKLVSHYDKFTGAYRMTDDFECQGHIVEAHMKVAQELLRHGVISPMAGLSDEERAFVERAERRRMPQEIVAKTIYVARRNDTPIPEAEAIWEKIGPSEYVEAG